MPRVTLFPDLEQYFVPILKNSDPKLKENLAFAKKILTRVNEKNIQSANVPGANDMVKLMTLANQLIFHDYFERGGLQNMPLLDALIRYANNIDQSPYGNCLDMAIYALAIGLEFFIETKSTANVMLSIIFFDREQTHFAIQIGDDEHGVVCDPWSVIVFPVNFLKDLSYDHGGIFFRSKTLFRDLFFDGKIGRYFTLRIDSSEGISCTRIHENFLFSSKQQSSKALLQSYTENHEDLPSVKYYPILAEKKQLLGPDEKKLIRQDLNPKLHGLVEISSRSCPSIFGSKKGEDACTILIERRLDRSLLMPRVDEFFPALSMRLKSLPKYVSPYDGLVEEVFNVVERRNIVSEDLHKDETVQLCSLANQLVFDASVGPCIGTEERSSLQTILAYANNVDQNPYGNCLEMAIYTFAQALQSLSKYNISKPINLGIIFFGKEKQSHFAVRIGSGDDAVICDTWAGVVFPEKYLRELQAFEQARPHGESGYPENYAWGIYGNSPATVYFSIEMLRKGAVRCTSIEEEWKTIPSIGSARKKVQITGFKHHQDKKSEIFYKDSVAKNQTLIGRLCHKLDLKGQLVHLEAIEEPESSALVLQPNQKQLLEAFQARRNHVFSEGFFGQSNNVFKRRNDDEYRSVLPKLGKHGEEDEEL